MATLVLAVDLEQNEKGNVPTLEFLLRKQWNDIHRDLGVESVKDCIIRFASAH